MTKNLINEIVRRLLENNIFNSYKFRKRDFSLVNKLSNGFELIEFQCYNGFDLSRNEEALVVKPLYLKRFDILHQWFEKYSFKSIRDQRDNYSIGFDGGQLGKNEQFYFLLSGEDFETDYKYFENETIANSQKVFIGFSTLEDIYNYSVLPILNGEKKLPIVGADWVFEYLTLAKLISYDDYNRLKNVILPHTKNMYLSDEPNIREYYPQMDEIVSYLERLEI